MIPIQMAEEKYGVAQRLAFLALGIGFLMCAGSGVAPYWLYGELSLNDIAKSFDVEIPFIGNMAVAKFKGGLFWFCAQIKIPTLDKDECQRYDYGKHAAETIGLLTFFAGVIITFLCMLAACCRMCCCQGGRTVCHGICAFLGGACFLTTLTLFALSTNDFWGYKLQLVDHGWAFYTFMSGGILIVLASFALCCAYPQSPIVTLVSNQLGQPVVISSANNQHQYNRLQADLHPLCPVQDWPQQSAGVQTLA